MFRPSRYFLGILTGIVLTVLAISVASPLYKILRQETLPLQTENLSGSLSLDDTAKALQEVYDIIQIQYYDTGSIDQTLMSRQAISSFVNALGDPFSSYLEPVENKELTDALDGNQTIEGIGAYLSKKDVGIMIEEVVKSSPAAQAGLKPMDIIVKVNATGVQNLSLPEVIQYIRGPRGTDVVLSVVRSLSGGSELIEKTVMRDTITIPSVSAKILTGEGGARLGYLALSMFGEDTNTRIQQEIIDFQQKGISGLILDLRGNGGGLLPEAVTIASHFLPKKTPVVLTKYRLYGDQMYYSEGTHDLNLPLVILIDEMTASASEILALAIKENLPDTIIVGKKSFGKGTIQVLQPVSFGGAIKLTVGKWFAPSGSSINGTGVIPDVDVDFDMGLYNKKSEDAQLEKAKQILSQKIRIDY